jgi:hypothetical protein
MRSFLLSILVTLALATAVRSQVSPEAAAASAAQKTPEKSPFAALTPEPPATPTAQPAATPRNRPISPEIAAKLSVNAPKFSTAKVSTSPAKELPDLREIDKPRNRIIRLPREMVEPRVIPQSEIPLEGSPGVLQLPTYVVRENKIPAFKERELLTPQGKLDLALKRRPGLRIGWLPFFSNAGVALAMLEEDFALERKKEMQDLLGFYRYSDPKSSAAPSIPTQPRQMGWIDSGGGHAESRQR